MIATFVFKSDCALQGLEKKTISILYFLKLHIIHILAMSGDNTNNSIFDWSMALPPVSVNPVNHVNQAITSLRGMSAQEIRRAAGAAALVAGSISSGSLDVAAGEKRVLDLMQGGEAAFQPQKKTQTSLVVEGNSVRTVKTIDQTEKDVMLEFYIPLPKASDGLVTYYKVEKQGKQLKVVDSTAITHLDVGCSRRKVGLQELTTVTEKTTRSRLYEQLAQAPDGDYVLYLMITALTQPADAMYNLSEGSHFVYSIGDGIELHNVSAARPVQVPISEMHKKISDTYAQLYAYTTDSKQNAPLLSQLCAATHHKLRNPDMLYELLVFGFPLSVNVTFEKIKEGCELFKLIDTQFKPQDRAREYRCIHVHNLSVGKFSGSAVVCIEHFLAPSSKQDCKMFSFASFFNTLLKNGFFVLPKTYSKATGLSSSVKLTSPVLDFSTAVDFKKLKQTIIESFFTSTGEARYPWETFEKQVKNLHDSGIPVSYSVAQDAFALELRKMLVTKPYDLVAIESKNLKCAIFNLVLHTSCYVDISILKRFVSKHDSRYEDEEVLDQDMDVSTEDLMKIFFKELEENISDEDFNFGSINCTILYLLFEAKPTYNFAKFIDYFAAFLFMKCRDSFKFQDDISDYETKQHSLAYFAVCFFSTMFVTCDLLCNCKDQNELGDVFIDAMLPNEYRSQPFTDLGPSIHKYAWSLYVDSKVTQDAKLIGCHIPVYPNLNVNTFVRYFAYYGKILDCGIEQPPESVEDAVKSARLFLDTILENVRGYVQVKSLHSKNETMFGQQLRNFQAHVQLDNSGSIFEVEKKS